MASCNDRLRMLLNVLTNQYSSGETSEGKPPAFDSTITFDEKYEELKDHIELSRGILSDTKAIIKSYV